MVTWIEGIDAAWGRPTPAQMIAAGKHFIVGYVSRDPAKNLTRAECTAYLDAGIAVGLVWETTSDRALAGAGAGTGDGLQARSQARALGFPDNRPIFTAVDFDATATQLSGPVRQYLIAFADAVGGVALAGVYGGLATVRYALNTMIVGWGWQTYAWSQGVWDVRAYARQYRNGVSIAGHDTDLDRAVDLSALWTKEGTDMTITDAESTAIAADVWSQRIPDMRDRTKPDVSAQTALAQMWGTVVGLGRSASTEAAQIVALTAALQAVVTSGGGTVDVTALLAGIDAAVARHTDAVLLRIAAAEKASADALAATP